MLIAHTIFKHTQWLCKRSYACFYNSVDFCLIYSKKAPKRFFCKIKIRKQQLLADFLFFTIGIAFCERWNQNDDTIVKRFLLTLRFQHWSNSKDFLHYP